MHHTVMQQRRIQHTFNMTTQDTCFIAGCVEIPVCILAWILLTQLQHTDAATDDLMLQTAREPVPLQRCSHVTCRQCVAYMCCPCFSLHSCLQLYQKIAHTFAEYKCLRAASHSPAHIPVQSGNARDWWHDSIHAHLNSRFDDDGSLQYEDAAACSALRHLVTVC